MRSKRLLRLIAIAGVAGVAACSSNSNTTKSTEASGTASTAAGPPSVSSEPFGQVGGTPVTRYTLSSGNGMRVQILNYGGIIQSIEVPDRGGHAGAVVF